jgi:hypothetical protein
VPVDGGVTVKLTGVPMVPVVFSQPLTDGGPGVVGSNLKLQVTEVPLDRVPSLT